MTSLSDLQARRVARGVSLQQISRATMITTRYLEAIERGAFEKLPGGVYTTSYLRQYARAIGCDEAALIDYYREVCPTPLSD
jgi:cytoskeleton protein RodZ